MSRAKNLAKLQDEEREGKLGYVFAVSGPGKTLLARALSPRTSPRREICLAKLPVYIAR